MESLAVELPEYNIKTISASIGKLVEARLHRQRPEQEADWRHYLHTDEGGQYCSTDYQAFLKRHSLHGSMSANGGCYDNACAGSLFHSLKVECFHGERFTDREMMRTTVFNHI